MSIQLIIHNQQGQEVLRLAGQDHKTFHQMVKEGGIDLPISCGVGICGFCRSKIIKGKEYIDFGKKSMPMKELADDEVFICVGGILSSAITTDESYEIILQTKI